MSDPATSGAYSPDWTHPRGRAWLVRRDEDVVWTPGPLCSSCTYEEAA